MSAPNATEHNRCLTWNTVQTCSRPPNTIEVITGSVPELRALDFETPAVRDPRAPSNVRQEGSGFLCGVYEARPARLRTPSPSSA